MSQVQTFIVRRIVRRARWKFEPNPVVMSHWCHRVERARAKRPWQTGKRLRDVDQGSEWFEGLMKR